MTKAMLQRVGAVLAALVLAVPLSAAADDAKKPASEQPYVVLVGISNYTDKQIKPRPHAEDDARALYDLLSEAKYLGVDRDHIRLLLGSEDTERKAIKATRANILEALTWAAKNAKTNDPVIVAFFGEGGPLGESGDRRCYFAVDSTVKGRDKDAVAAVEVGDAIKNLRSHRFCVFLDVDFKGFEAEGKTAIAEPTLGNAPYKEFLGDDGTEDHTPKPGRILFLATNGLARSIDLKDHGLFAEVLLKGLRGEADKDGGEPDGSVTVDELTEYVDKAMPELAAKHGKTEEERLQAHFVLGGRSNHFVLTYNPAVTAKVKARLEKFEKLVKDGKVPEKYVEEGKSYLEHMPRLEAQRSIRKQYQELADGTITVEKFETERDKILESTKLRRAEAVEFAQKVMETVEIIQEKYVRKTKPHQMVEWAIRGLYRRLDEKVPEAIEERLSKIEELKESGLASLLADARQALGRREDLSQHKDIDITLQRMLSHLDPYTTYIDPETRKQFEREIQGFFTGVGIQIRKDSVTDQLLVVTPIKGSPAYKAGLQAGDIITKVVTNKFEVIDPVEGKIKVLDEKETIHTKGLSLNAAVKKILGPEETEVVMTIQREGQKDPIDVRITRARINVESVMGVKRKGNDDWDFVIDPERKIGYARVTTFAKHTYEDLKRAMLELQEDGCKGFILDLRFNPGGLLKSAVDITDMYIDDGVIVSVKDRSGKQERHMGHHRGSMLDFPMVCLVNGYSASASEIVSAALQDHRRAYIIGERSYGKGSVQNIDDFDGGQIKLTTASWWRPSGKNLDKASTSGKDEDEWGVTPDLAIKMSRKDREDLAEHQHDTEIILPKEGKPAKKKEFKDRQLEAALEYLRGQIKTASRVPPRKDD
jgi:C-terminal peptidase prc